MNPPKLFCKIIYLLFFFFAGSGNNNSGFRKMFRIQPDPDSKHLFNLLFSATALYNTTKKNLIFAEKLVCKHEGEAVAVHLA